MAPRFSIWMVVAGVVVGVLGGYLAGSRVVGNGQSAMREPHVGSVRDGKSSRERTGSRVAKSASALLRDEALRGAAVESLDSDEWFDLLFSLHEQRLDYQLDTLERQKLEYQASLLISQMPAPAIRELLERLRASDLGSHRRMRNAMQGLLMRRLVDCDPDAALAWTESIKDGEPWMSVALEALSQTDPERVGQVMRERLESGQVDKTAYDRHFGSDALARVARHAAQGGVEEFLEFLEWAPSHHNLILGMSDAVPREKIQEFVEEWRRRVAEGKAEEHEVAFFLNHWAEVAPDEMRAWFSEVEGAGDASVALAESVGHSLMLVDRSEGMAFFEEQFRGDPERARELYRSRVSFYLYSPKGLAEFSDLLPPEVPPQAEDFERFTNRLLNNPHDIVTAASVFRDAEERFAFLEQLLTDEAVAEYWPLHRPGARPGPNENDLRSVRVALEELELDEAQRAEVFRMFDAAAFGEGEASAAE